MPSVKSPQLWICLCTVCLAVPIARGQALENADIGPFMVNTIQGPQNNTAYKGVVIKLGKDGEAAVCFDAELLRYMGGWVKTEGNTTAEPKADVKPPKPGAKPAEPSIWPSGDWAGLIDPNHSTAFTAHHGGPPKVRGGEQVMRFATKPGPGWGGGEKGDDFTDPRKTSPVDKQPLGNLPKEWAHYRGLYRNGNQVVLSYTVGDCNVLETPGLIGAGEYPTFTRTIRVDKSDKSMTLVVCDVSGATAAHKAETGGSIEYTLESGSGDKERETTVGLAGAPAGYAFSFNGSPADRVTLTIPPHAQPQVFELTISNSPKASPTTTVNAGEMIDPATLIKGGPALWGPALETTGKLDDSGSSDDAYVVDTLTAPENNPYHAFMRFTGFDMFSDGHTAAISTIGGDVWIVTGIDEKLDHLKWKRFATGLFQPLGLKVRNDVVYTVGRDQITALHDLNGDGEADFYENFNNDCQVTSNYHEFTLDIQTDSEGNFYYSKGCPWPPNVTSDDQGTMLKVSYDGSKMEVFCTGLRAPNGSAMDEHDELYTGDNEGHWTPSSKFEHLRKGKFYGMVPAAHLPGGEKPTTFEPPVFWLPHGGVDNSSGAMAFAPAAGNWGPLNGHMLAASYGLSSLFAAMTEEVDGIEQGAAVKFPVKFGSSVMRARFNGGRNYPRGDGQLYLCGLKGWQTNAGRDGAFQRVRYTGKPWTQPIEFHAARNGLLVTFTEPLDKKEATDAENWGSEQWNYHWTQNYGSKEFSLRDPTVAKHDELQIKGVQISEDGKTVLLQIDGLGPVNQIKTTYNIKTAAGKELKGDIYSTINIVGPERKP
jgi:glucose/arabinose dehydrogenase